MTAFNPPAHPLPSQIFWKGQVLFEGSWVDILGTNPVIIDSNGLGTNSLTFGELRALPLRIVFHDEAGARNFISNYDDSWDMGFSALGENNGSVKSPFAAIL